MKPIPTHNSYFLFSTNVLIPIVVLGIFLIIFIIAAFVIHIEHKHTEFVLTNSRLLKELEQLNQRYRFRSFQCKYYHYKTLSSKSSYDKAQFSSLLLEFANAYERLIYQNIEHAETNTQMYRMYCNEYQKLLERNNYSAEYYNNDFFIEIEKRLFQEKIQHPSTTFEVVITKQYTSPQGRNHYSDYQVYSASQLKNAIAQTNQQKERQQARDSTRQAERAKMSESLRYEILRRDKGRCCLCGASAKDGAKLHVDHIRPIAKGGKTEPSNLRTLCDRCNLGKGAKYNPNGYN